MFHVGGRVGEEHSFSNADGSRKVRRKGHLDSA